MNFVKMQATGNDFVLIDARKLERDWSRLAVAMCDRHFGIGADGLLLVLPSDTADFRMRMFNPDGSEAETCGNGLRCFAKFVVESGLSPTTRELRVETLAGMITLRATINEGVVDRVQVNMGAPQLSPAEIPVILKAQQGRGQVLDITSIIDYPIKVKGRELLITCVSMGNPHAVCFLDEPVAQFPLAELGPVVEHHPMFPNRTNFEVVNVVNRRQAVARVWERGAGETLACGSGACAIAVAARLHNLIKNSLDITLPGGTLTVDWDGEVWLTGPVAFVFKGEWSEQDASQDLAKEKVLIEDLMRDWLADPLGKRTPSKLEMHQFSSLNKDAQNNWQVQHNWTKLKLDGAAYHYGMAKGSSSLAPPYDKVGMYWRLVSWHLDSFFFELVSSFDSMLQEVNIRYGVAIPRRNIAWKNEIKEKFQNKIPTEVFQLIDEEWNADWFVKVREYRNTATHRSPLRTLEHWSPHIIGEHEVQMWTEKYKDEPIRKCEEYLRSMANLIVDAWGKFELEPKQKGE